MGDEYEPYQWQVGDPADWGDSVGVPDIPYMGYLNNGNDDDECERPANKSRVRQLSDEAWDYVCEENYDAALLKINSALDIDDRHHNDWNRKAIILEGLNRYEDAFRCYDESLKRGGTNVVRSNKAFCIKSYLSIKLMKNQITSDDLNLINEALKILPDSENSHDFLYCKGEILEKLAKPVDAHICFLLAAKMYDDVKKVEDQRKIIKNSRSTLICVTGTQHYKGSMPLKPGVILDLIKEPENKFDRDAIRVEINGETVGYVGNSDYTTVEGTVKASMLDMPEKSAMAKVMFMFASRFIIAKIIQ